MTGFLNSLIIYFETIEVYLEHKIFSLVLCKLLSHDLVILTYFNFVSVVLVSQKEFYCVFTFCSGKKSLFPSASEYKWVCFFSNPLFKEKIVLSGLHIYSKVPVLLFCIITHHSVHPPNTHILFFPTSQMKLLNFSEASLVLSFLWVLASGVCLSSDCYNLEQNTINWWLK